MPLSIVTGNYTTTIPREIRQKLSFGPGDVLEWTLVGDRVEVRVGRVPAIEVKRNVKRGGKREP